MIYTKNIFLWDQRNSPDVYENFSIKHFPYFHFYCTSDLNGFFFFFFIQPKMGHSEFMDTFYVPKIMTVEILNSIESWMIKVKKKKYWFCKNTFFKHSSGKKKKKLKPGTHFGLISRNLKKWKIINDFHS